MTDIGDALRRMDEERSNSLQRMTEAYIERCCPTCDEEVADPHLLEPGAECDECGAELPPDWLAHHD